MQNHKYIVHLANFLKNNRCEETNKQRKKERKQERKKEKEKKNEDMKARK
jgi:hypothetical protein